MHYENGGRWYDYIWHPCNCHINWCIFHSVSEAFFRFLNSGGFGARLFYFVNLDCYSLRFLRRFYLLLVNWIDIFFFSPLGWGGVHCNIISLVNPPLLLIPNEHYSNLLFKTPYYFLFQIYLFFSNFYFITAVVFQCWIHAFYFSDNSP